MSTPPSELPPPPPAGPAPAPSSGPTQIVGQQSTPTSTVPHTPDLPQTTGQAGKTNQLAIISLVAGIGSFPAHIIPGLGGFVVSIIAIATGYMARNEIKRTGESGMGLATAGMIIGIVHIALIVLTIVGLIIAIFVFGIALFGISHSASSG